jgi:hypothetical protein
MFGQVSAAVAAAAIAVMFLAPAQSNARGGAGMAARGGGFHPPVRPSHPVLVHRHDPLFARRNFRDRHAFDHRHHRRNGDGFAGYGYGSGGYGGGYGGNGYGDNGYADNGYDDYPYGGYAYCRYGYRDAYPLTCSDYTAFYGRYYDPSDVPGSIWVPPYTVRPSTIMSTAGRVDPPGNRGGCRSESVAVAAPGGAERSVTIMRC